MICRNPYIMAGRAFGCGQCMPCRINKRRVWSTRIMLEARQYADNAFITLTYSDEKLPSGGNLVPKHVQDWMKRVRRGFSRPLRFYLVGEYGDASFRPHYHVALFNYPSCLFGVSQYNTGRSDCCASCDYIRDTWSHGLVHVGTLTKDSASYLCNYVTKKMTDKSDPRLDGRYPEFARMSLKPGIAGDAMWELSDVLLKYDLVKVDVPSRLATGKKMLPLGRYLMRRTRKFVGMDESTPDEVMEELDAEMLALRLAAKADNENPSLKSRVVDKNLGKILQVEARSELYRKRRVV